MPYLELSEISFDDLPRIRRPDIHLLIGCIVNDLENVRVGPETGCMPELILLAECEYLIATCFSIGSEEIVLSQTHPSPFQVYVKARVERTDDVPYPAPPTVPVDKYEADGIVEIENQARFC